MKNIKNNNIALYALVIGLFLTASAQAATFTVDRTDDATVSNCVDGVPNDCTLRGAIAAANAATNADIIEFDATVFNTPQTITLSGTQLAIAVNSTLTINGPTALLTISGNNASRLFLINSGANAAISDINLTGGNGVGSQFSGSGGAILISGTLTLTNSTISGNTATGFGGGLRVVNPGTLTLTNSTVSNNSSTTSSGGGIYNEGTLTVNFSTINNNTGNNGGAIFTNGTNHSVTLNNSNVRDNTSTGTGGGFFNTNTSTITLNNSTVSGNSAGSGGGFDNRVGATLMLNNSTVSGNTSSGGGGIANTSIAILTNSTVSGNSATNAANNASGGGISNGNGGTLTLNNSTLSGNSATSGGGILNGGTTTLDNTIIANSTGGDCAIVSGTVNASYSLIEDGLTCVNGTNSNNLTGDPNLGPLQNNGGSTQTHALLPGSIAIDAGSNALVPAGVTTDQRGQNRISDGDNNGSAIVDMGSFEALAPTAASVSISGRVSDGRRGVARAIVHITDQDGNIRTARTNQFGYYNFDDVEVGQVLIVNVFNKRYQFDTQVLTVNESLANLNFTAQDNRTLLRR